MKQGTAEAVSLLLLCFLWCFSAVAISIDTPENGDGFCVERDIDFLASKVCLVTGVRWEFGDDKSADGNPVKYAYKTPGLYTVTAIDKRTEETNQVTILVMNLAPVLHDVSAATGDIPGAAAAAMKFERREGIDRFVFWMSPPQMLVCFRCEYEEKTRMVKDYLGKHLRWAVVDIEGLERKGKPPWPTDVTSASGPGVKDKDYPGITYKSRAAAKPYNNSAFGEKLLTMQLYNAKNARVNCESSTKFRAFFTLFPGRDFGDGTGQRKETPAPASIAARKRTRTMPSTAA